MTKMYQEERSILNPPRSTLDELAHDEPIPRLWTDKRTRREGDDDYILHGYLPIYDREFGQWRDEPIRMLEIGLNVGASIKLWLQYFTKAQIVGFDIADFKFAPEIEQFVMDYGLLKRFNFYRGDALNPADLQRFVESQPEPFDIIIDDGAHSSGTIITAFHHLWPRVKPGGYYVIEDITEVKNIASHTPGLPNQRQFAETLIGQIIMGENDIAEAFVSKDLVMLRKK